MKRDMFTTIKIPNFLFMTCRSKGTTMAPLSPLLSTCPLKGSWSEKQPYNCDSTAQYTSIRLSSKRQLASEAA